MVDQQPGYARMLVHLPPEGLGVSLREKVDTERHGWFIQQIVRQSYAHRLGLTYGDCIVQINMEGIENWPLSRVIEELKSSKVNSLGVVMRQRKRVRFSHPKDRPFGITIRQSKSVPGFKVDIVHPDSYAASIGIEQGDMIISLNNVDITNWKPARVLNDMVQMDPGYITLIKPLEAEDTLPSPSLSRRVSRGFILATRPSAGPKDTKTTSWSEGINRIGSANEQPPSVGRRFSTVLLGRSKSQSGSNEDSQKLQGEEPRRSSFPFFTVRKTPSKENIGQSSKGALGVTSTETSVDSAN